MAYQTGTASDQTDLMNKLNTFAAANGYTTDYYNGTTNFLALSRPADACYVTFAWDDVNTIAMYQALGFSATYQEAPWNQANDSGNGSDTIPGSIDAGRQVSEIGAGPFTTYYFFAYTSPAYAIHVVLEFSPGLYRHFGFGRLEKTGTWTGGAWCAGHLWNPATSYASFSDVNSYNHTVLLDGLLDPGASGYGAYNNDSHGTLHVEGLPGQPSGGKWGVAGNPAQTDADVGEDRGSTDRIRIAGGMRAGMAVSQWAAFLPDLSNGFIPIIPIEVFYLRSRYGADGYYYLGKMPNIGLIHMLGIDPAQELTIGADTWTVFPSVRKSSVGGINQESQNQGIIYKKVV